MAYIIDLDLCVRKGLTFMTEKRIVMAVVSFIKGVHLRLSTQTGTSQRNVLK